MSLQSEYEIRYKTPSDINEHLSTLKHLSSLCKHVTEFGVRGGNSTVALAAGLPKRMISHDINPMPPGIAEMIREAGIKFDFLQGNVLEIGIVETELLFIDTLHTYTQLKAELARHSVMAKRFMVFHDTVTFGNCGEDGATPGLRRAIFEFLNDHPKWVLSEEFTNNNGLMILEWR